MSYSRGRFYIYPGVGDDGQGTVEFCQFPGGGPVSVPNCAIDVWLAALMVDKPDEWARRLEHGRAHLQRSLMPTDNMPHIFDDLGFMPDGTKTALSGTAEERAARLRELLALFHPGLKPTEPPKEAPNNA